MDEVNWEKVRIDAAIAAMQATMTAEYLGTGKSPSLTAEKAVLYADELVEELKKKIKC